MMLLGAVFVLLYTILGGFLAESASDFMQGIVMIVALSVIVIISTVQAGGFGQVIQNGAWVTLVCHRYCFVLWQFVKKTN